MTIASVLQGVGIPLKFTLWKDKDAGTEYLWSEIEDVVVWIYGKSGSVIERYSLNARTDHNTEDFSKVSETDAIFRIRMQEDVTKKAREEKATIEIKWWYKDANWTGGLRPFIAKADALSLYKALTKSLTA